MPAKTKNALAEALKAIYIVVNTKGGVGKTTTSLQVVIPWLFERINKSATPSNETKKIKLYEIDENNDSKQNFGNSQIMDTHLVVNPEKELEDIFINECASLERDYPIVFDIGVGPSTKALDTLANITLDEKIIFIVPTKNDEDDYNDTLTTIEKIKQINKKPNIIIVCSDSRWDFGDEENYLKPEFGLIFGEFLNLKTNKPFPSIFSQGAIDENYTSLTKTALFIETKVSMQQTLYEVAKTYSYIESSKGNNEYEKRLVDAKSKYEELAKAGDIEKASAANKEFLLERKKLALFRSCKNFATKNLYPVFEKLESIIISNFFN